MQEHLWTAVGGALKLFYRAIDQAYSWYEGHRTGLGEDFLSCVDACIQAVCRAPEMYATIHENYGRGLVRRFPYAVFHEFEAETVTVYCVFHISRHPDKRRRHLP